MTEKSRRYLRWLYLSATDRVQINIYGFVHFSACAPALEMYVYTTLAVVGPLVVLAIKVNC